jgi:CheY-like chemotaxis protein
MNCKSVLVIDDDTFTIELQRMLVEIHDLKTYAVFESTGENAIQKLKELHQQKRFPDYILLDIHMPDMTGFEFLDDYAKLFQKAGYATKIFMVTSSISESDRKNASQHPGIHDYLVKPIPNDFIVNLIKG